MSRTSLISVFGPTAAGKTGVAVEIGRILSERGQHAVAVNCDSIQVYQGLEVLSGAADAMENGELEHRLLSFVPVNEEFSAGRYAQLARAEIDRILADGSRPILVGGTGLYLRGALTEMEFRAAVPQATREAVEREIADRGAAALHAELPSEYRASTHPNDRKRISRITELLREGRTPAGSHEQGGELWTAGLRHSTLLVGLAEDPEVLGRRIDARVEAMARDGAGPEATKALADGASRTARAAIGFSEFLEGDLELAATRHRQFARRQMTWMRRMNGVEIVERTGRGDRELAIEIVSLADDRETGNAEAATSG